MLKKILLFLSIGFLAFSSAQEAVQFNSVTISGQEYLPNDQLPRDSSIISGELENGLDYYLVQNTEPHNRAELALVIAAGSVLEEDDQLGLAHFLEHMLFNGTKNFPNQELISFLETVGMEFGPDVNAYTSFDETVYTLTIPLDDPETTQKALQVLVDWAAFASLDPTEIDKERGVIVEEWRARQQNVSGRLNEQIRPALYGDSRYSKRSPIGDMDIVRNAPYEALSRYYNKWYRPDLMAVVAVGDFDIAEFELQIKTAFSKLSNPIAEVVKEEYEIAIDSEPEYLVITDPELSVSLAQVVYKRPSKDFNTIQDFADDLARGLFSRMLNTRLDDLTRAEPVPFLRASYGVSALAAGVETLQFTVISQEGEIEPALIAMLTELERLHAFGFNDDELARAKAAFLSNFEQNYNQRQDIDSANISSGLVSTHLDGSAYTSMETDLELAKQLLEIIDLETVNSYDAEFTNARGRLVLVLGPEKEALVLPNEAELVTIFNQVENIQVADVEQKEVAQSLMTQLPEPKPSIKQEHIDSLDLEHLVLANGIQLYIKKTDFVADQVLLSGVSYGGSSVYENDDYYEASIISSIIQESGVANFDLNELEKILAAKNVSIGVSISNLSEGISGSSSKKDIEDLFQLVYLYATKPRKDFASFERIQDLFVTSLENRNNLPSTVYQKAITESLYGQDIRYRTITIDEVKELDYARAFAIYKERFADMDDFVFTIVGDIDIEQVISLAEQYLANLPAQAGQETWQKRVPDLPAGIIEKTVYKGLEEQAQVLIRFDGPFFKPDRKERMKLAILKNILAIKVRQDIREERSGAYSPRVFSSVSKRPSRRYSLGVQFTADPKRVDELSMAVLDILKDVRNTGVSDEELQKAKEQLKSNFQEQLESNGYWAYLLEYYYALNQDEDPNNILNYSDVVDSISKEEVHQMAQRFINPARYIKVVLLPESYE